MNKFKFVVKKVGECACWKCHRSHLNDGFPECDAPKAKCGSPDPKNPHSRKDGKIGYYVEAEDGSVHQK